MLNATLKVHMQIMINLAHAFVILALEGHTTARNLSTAVAVRVKTLTDNVTCNKARFLYSANNSTPPNNCPLPYSAYRLTVSMNVTTLHIIFGKYQVCNRAAW